MSIAILSAMAEENASLITQMSEVESIEIGGRHYHQGKLWGTDVVVVFSHWGKVAAASTATVLIDRFKVSEIIFTGVAGGIDRTLNIGDIVIASDLYQHDMDARPIIGRHEIPLLGVTALPSSVRRGRQLLAAARRFVNSQLADTLGADTINEFLLHSPKVLNAPIASGDQFISSEQCADDIRNRLPEVVCVEMEGASVAQVCTEFGIPFSVVRTISDAANEQAGIDFPKFIHSVAQTYSLNILKNLFDDIDIENTA